MLPTKFQFICDSSFRREDFLEISQTVLQAVFQLYSDRTRTSSIIYKNYIEITEGIGKAVNNFRLQLKKYEELFKNEKLSLL